MRQHFDVGTIAVIVVTFVLFVMALFTKGLTHDLFLEIAVFLVSVKLVIMGFKNSVYIKTIEKELKELNI